VSLSQFKFVLIDIHRDMREVQNFSFRFEKNFFAHFGANI